MLNGYNWRSSSDLTQIIAYLFLDPSVLNYLSVTLFEKILEYYRQCKWVTLIWEFNIFPLIEIQNISHSLHFHIF